MNPLVKKAKRKPSQGPFVCYALQDVNKLRSYTGQTNNFTRRLRQHNGELKGGARYTSRVKSKGPHWSPIFQVCGFQTLRSVLQFEIAMKKRKVPVSFRIAGKTNSIKGAKKAYTRGPTGRVRQLEYLLSLGRLNNEPHSPFSTNGIYVQVHVSKKKYLKMAQLKEGEFELLRQQQGVHFRFCP